MDKRLCMATRIPGTAGPANFQKRLELGLSTRGVQITYDLSDRPYDSLLVIGATRNLAGLFRIRKAGIPIIQRLDGMNWIHRRVRTGWKHFLRAEVNNLLLRFIRQNLASCVVYQSHFAQTWWERVHGKTPVESRVIYNGVPLDIFTPEGEGQPPSDRVVVLMVEGNLSGGYEVGVGLGVDLVRRMQERISQRVELSIAGSAPQEIRSHWEREDDPFIHWLGLVSPEDIPKFDRSAHVLYSGDPNPACPNAVIEAMACGLPVVAFETGALPELVTRDAGKLVDYGGDPWRLERPNVEALVDATLELVDHQDRYRAGARDRALEQFGLDDMVESYMAVI